MGLNTTQETLVSGNPYQPEADITREYLSGAGSHMEMLPMAGELKYGAGGGHFVVEPTVPDVACGNDLGGVYTVQEEDENGDANV